MKTRNTTKKNLPPASSDILPKNYLDDTNEIEQEEIINQNEEVEELLHDSKKTKSLVADETKDKKNYTESSVQWYLEEINKIPLLSREEEDRLARLTIKGDQDAKNKLVTANLRFVVQVAKKYQKFGISLLDLINEGNMGLIRAAERFDPDMGYHFISYAVWWIRQAIILAINQKTSIIRLPMNRTIDLKRIEKITKELENELGHEPTLDQVADRLDIPIEEIKWLKQISGDYISLDAPLSEDSDGSQIAAVEDDKYETPEDEAMTNALSDSINKILEELTTSERNIIEYRFGLNNKPRLSLTQVGKKFKLSKERVRQIEKKTLTKLKKYGHRQELEAFLEPE